MRRQALALLLVASLSLTTTVDGAVAEVARPAYSLGDFWTYATNLTDEVGLTLDGASRIEVVRFGSLSIQGVETAIAELLVKGGGTFSGTSDVFGKARGTWSITGTEAWETVSWKSVRSFLRLTADGELTGGATSLPFTLSLTNETTRRSLSDAWRWPVVEGTTGGWTAHWAGTQNVTISVQGALAGWNSSTFVGEHAISYEYLKAERVTVAAGEFAAHVLREEGPEGISRIRWYAPSVGNDVRQEEYNASGGLVATAELTAFAFSAGLPAPTFSWFLALNGVLVGAAVVLVVALTVRRRRRPIEVWMPPDGQVRNRPPGPSP